ncbi:MAG: GtrA family protein [Anaerolineae bacterium]
MAEVTQPARRNPLVGRFLKWSAVGTVGAGVDYAVLILLVEAVGLHPLIAQGISFSAAVVNNYLWNRTWTFGDMPRRPIAAQFSQFLLVSIAGLGIRTIIFVILFQMLGIWYILATAVAIVVVLAWNFLVNLAWTFRYPS